MSVRKQARTHTVSIRSIVASKEFARGVDEVRKGLRFNPDIDDWNYERRVASVSSRRWRCRYGSVAC
jgi:hypothetical protein